jgi:ketosteroid isomerase-like protein
MKPHAVLLAMAALALMPGCKVTVTDSDDSASVLRDIEAVERARFKAFIAADAATVRPMLANDLVYCHSTGVCQNKEEIIAFVTSGTQRYLGMDILAFNPRAIGDAVVINGKINARVETNGKADSFQAIYTDVYAKRDGRWQLVSWQSTRLP